MRFFVRILFGICILSVVTTTAVFADSDESAVGWMWGGSETAGGGVLDNDETGIGWLSMNSLNCDPGEDGDSDGGSGCPASGTAVADYGVDIPPDDDDIHGYAWGETVGWISFQQGDLVGCPALPCKAYRTGNDIRGWARILSIPSEGANAGGFEGWIKLHSESGDPIVYGGVVTPGPLSTIDGYAWSNEFGWIRFEDVKFLTVHPSIIICPISASTSIGGSIQLTAHYRDDGQVLSCAQLADTTDVTADADTTWSSSNDAIATVDNGASKGIVTGVSAGGPMTIHVAYMTILGAPINVTMLLTVNNTVTTCGNGTVEPDGPDGIAGTADDEDCDDGAGNGSCAEGVSCSTSCETNVCQCVTIP